MTTSHFKQFHESLNKNPSLLADAGRPLRLGQTLCWLIDESETYVYQKLKNGLKIVANKVPAELTIRISAKNFQRLIDEDLSLFGLIYSNSLEIVKGDYSMIDNWYSALQQLFYQRPIWHRDIADAFAHIDLQQSFDLATQQKQAGEFLREAGFVHLKSVFSPDEVTAFKAAVAHQVTLANANDKQSWWAKNRKGDELCCRLIYLNQHQPLFADFPTDPRMLAIAELAKEHLLPAGNRMDGVNCVMKHSEVVEGIADLAWHKDCDLGGHSLICPGLIVGIQLDPANAENGQLRFLAGSQHSSNSQIDETEPGLPIAAIETQPGDVTAHFCHVSHEAPAPKGTNANRRVLYCGYYQQKLLDRIPEGQSYNDVLYTTGDGLMENIKD